MGRRPWSPCHVAARRLGDGDIVVSWVRRARDDRGLWTELEVGGEDGEQYRLDVLDGLGAPGVPDGAAVKRSFVTSEPDAVYAAAMQAADWGGPAPSPLSVRVVQVSPQFGDGVPARANLVF